MPHYVCVYRTNEEPSPRKEAWEADSKAQMTRLAKAKAKRNGWEFVGVVRFDPFRKPAATGKEGKP